MTIPAAAAAAIRTSRISATLNGSLLFRRLNSWRHLKLSSAVEFSTTSNKETCKEEEGLGVDSTPSPSNNRNQQSSSIEDHSSTSVNKEDQRHPHSVAESVEPVRENQSKSFTPFGIWSQVKVPVTVFTTVLGIYVSWTLYKSNFNLRKARLRFLLQYHQSKQWLLYGTDDDQAERNARFQVGFGL